MPIELSKQKNGYACILMLVDYFMLNIMCLLYYNMLSVCSVVMLCIHVTVDAIIGSPM